LKGDSHGGPSPGETDQSVSGSLRFMYSSTAGGTAQLDLTIGGVPQAAQGFTDTQALAVGDGSGAPGSPDYVSVGSMYTYLSAPSLLHPYSVYWGNGLWQLLLRDGDGTAWRGLTGPLPPASPPDAGAFETRDIQLLQQSCEDFGHGTCTGGFTESTVLYDVTIDAFTVPEPSVFASFLLALAACLAARSRPLSSRSSPA
jgi:hypothetical protein